MSVETMKQHEPHKDEVEEENLNTQGLIIEAIEEKIHHIKIVNDNIVFCTK